MSSQKKEQQSPPTGLPSTAQSVPVGEQAHVPLVQIWLQHSSLKMQLEPKCSQPQKPLLLQNPLQQSPPELQV